MGRQVQDLIGHVSGYLTVVQYDGLRQYAGQNTGFWICHCERCGMHTVLPRKKLVSPRKDVRYTCCQSCRVGNCIICGTKIGVGRNDQLTCGGKCLRLHDTYRSQQSKNVAAAKDPEYHRKKYLRQKELHRKSNND